MNTELNALMEALKGKGYLEIDRARTESLTMVVMHNWKRENEKRLVAFDAGQGNYIGVLSFEDAYEIYKTLGRLL